MKKFLIIAAGVFVFGYTIQQALAIPNPWTDCGDDISCGAKKAGFNLPLRVEKYDVRAMKDMLEITFPLDKKRSVTLRKTQNYDVNMSGVYENYPVNKTILVQNCVPFNVRGDKNKFYVATFAAENGYYSLYSKQGMKLKDINYLYNLLSEAEAPRYLMEEVKTLEQLQDLRRDKDGIVEPVYTQDCFPRTLQKKGVTKNCFERANLGQDDVCSLSEVKMIKEYYKKGYKHDSLNDGSGNFCAAE